MTLKIPDGHAMYQNCHLQSLCTKYNKVGIFGKKLTYHLATLVSEIDPQPTWSQSYEICTLQRQRQRCSRLERL
jgi:hypothetical protein